MFPLLLMGVLGTAAGVWENKAATEAADLEPKIMGVNASTAGIVAGLLGILIGGPFLAPFGLSLATASYVSKDATARAKQGLDKLIAAAVAKQMAAQGGAPAALPAPAPPALPGPAPAGGFFQMLQPLAQAFRPAAEQAPA